MTNRQSCLVIKPRQQQGIDDRRFRTLPDAAALLGEAGFYLKVNTHEKPVVISHEVDHDREAYIASWSRAGTLCASGIGLPGFMFIRDGVNTTDGSRWIVQTQPNL